MVRKNEPDEIDLDDVKDGFKLEPGQFLRMKEERDPKLFVYYEVALRFRERLYGGVPKDPKIVEAWLAKNTGFNDGTTKAMIVQTLRERGVTDVNEDMTPEEMNELVKDMADKKVNGFKFDDISLYIEGRQIVAAIKESTNILWAGEKMGPTRKGAKSFVAERVFIPASKVRLLKPDGKTWYKEPDGIETNLVHTTGPAGRISAFTRSEYVDGAIVKFCIKALRGQLEVKRFVDLFLHIGENGIGAARSQGKGKCDVIGWEEIEELPDDYTEAAG